MDPISSSGRLASLNQLNVTERLAKELSRLRTAGEHQQRRQTHWQCGWEEARADPRAAAVGKRQVRGQRRGSELKSNKLGAGSSSASSALGAEPFASSAAASSSASSCSVSALRGSGAHRSRA